MLTLGISADIARSLGSHQHAQSVLRLEAGQLSAFAKARAESAATRMGQQQGQTRPMGQGSVPGTQNNPIEIVTPAQTVAPPLPASNMANYAGSQLQPAAQIMSGGDQQRQQQQQQQGRPPSQPPYQQSPPVQQ